RAPARPGGAVRGGRRLGARGPTAGGRGRVFPWRVVRRPAVAAFEPLLPYAAGLIELDEAVFMVGQIRGCDPQEVRAGMAVRVEFDDVTADVSLPHWRVGGRPASSASVRRALPPAAVAARAGPPRR